MLGQKTIQVSLIVAIMIMCYDARYLLINIDGGDEVGSNDLVKPLQNLQKTKGINGQI